ncbi:MAG: tripartite tricarboxylate transporter substrate binding protein [Pseudomonadota bacterium]|uniref:Bug family tripartite tricarboxylate transporter substrate binding protein n=1 Tax=Polaromonas aquatica TaxID=332657 RepID=A0ABW1U3V1_9BURK
MSKTDISRRRILHTAGAALLATPMLARAAWPDKPIRLIVPSQAGGSPDILCRILTSELGRLLGQPFVIDNKPGAGGNIGMQELVRSPADGYTLGYGNVNTLAINKSLYKKLPYDPDKQLVPIAIMGYTQSALVVRNDLPVNTVKDLIALAKARPGKLTAGSAGTGTTGHLGTELFKSMTNTFMVHVPYRGSPQAIQDLIGGQIDVMFDNIGSIAPHIQSGRVRILGVSGRSRSRLFPNVPTIAEAGVPGYETTSWGGIVAPIGTPRDIVFRLNAEINKALGTPSLNEKFNALAFETAMGPPERLFDRALRETRMWSDIVQRSGAQVD